MIRPMPISLSFFNNELSKEQKTDIYTSIKEDESFYYIINSWYEYGIRYKFFKDINLLIDLISFDDVTYGNSLATRFIAYLRLLEVEYALANVKL